MILAVDRAGLVGEDGETHHGVFDVGFLRQAPGLTVLCPGSRKELQDMLRWAVYEQEGPVAIRYPRGGDKAYIDAAWDCHVFPRRNGALCCHRKGNDVTLITYGTMLENAMYAAKLLEQRGIEATVLRLMTVSPLPVEQIIESISATHKVVVIEDTCTGSGVHEALTSALYSRLPDCKVTGIDLGHRYVPHGAVDALHRYCGLDAESIAKKVEEVCQSEN